MKHLLKALTHTILILTILVVTYTGSLAAAPPIKDDPVPVIPVTPTITVPLLLSVDPGDFVQVKPTTNGKNIKWKLGRNAKTGLTVFPAALLKDPSTFVAIAKNTPGTYSVYFWTSLNDELSDIAECQITVTGIPVPPAPPIPVPPNPPNPPVPPIPPVPPPSPAPIDSPGKRVLIIYESGELNKMPEKQQQILFSKSMRDYLNSKCEPDSDGKTKAWRIYDKDVDLTGESKVWQSAMARKRTQVPWIIISNGTTGYEGSLPSNVDETMTLYKKYLE